MSADALKPWLNDLLGPVLYKALSFVYWMVVAPVLTAPRFTVLLLGTTLAVAVFAFFVMTSARGGLRGLVAFVLPRGVFLHPSAILDYKFFLVNQLLLAHFRLGTAVIGLVGLLSISDVGQALLTAAFGPRESVAAGFAALLLFTVITFLAMDFARWFAHYLLHKVPVLWEFHKVHHAAEVLTPLTAIRSHPLEILLDLLSRLILAGAVGGVFAYLYPTGIKELQILGFNAVGFFVYYWISHLHHSHIPVGYGRHLSKLLISPVMHHIHHSQETHHWDRNFGVAFSIWDLAFKTIYVPKPGEPPFRLGLPEGKGAGEFNTLRDLYLRPFVGSWRLFFGGKRSPTIA